MNRYPLWKYLLILAALLAGLIYTLPNFYGESPAVQVSPLRISLKADGALLERVEKILEAASIKPEVAALDGNSVKARFTDTDSQLKAKDILASQLGGDYMVALAAVVNRAWRVADVPRPGLARRRSFPAAS